MIRATWFWVRWVVAGVMFCLALGLVFLGGLIAGKESISSIIDPKGVPAEID